MGLVNENNVDAFSNRLHSFAKECVIEQLVEGFAELCRSLLAFLRVVHDVGANPSLLEINQILCKNNANKLI